MISVHSCSIEFPQIYLSPNRVFKRWLGVGVECAVFTRPPNDIILDCSSY